MKSIYESSHDTNLNMSLLTALYLNIQYVAVQRTNDTTRYHFIEHADHVLADRITFALKNAACYYM